MHQAPMLWSAMKESYAASRPIVAPWLDPDPRWRGSSTGPGLGHVDPDGSYGIASKMNEPSGLLAFLSWVVEVSHSGHH